jgi:hypothetical protein
MTGHLGRMAIPLCDPDAVSPHLGHPLFGLFKKNDVLLRLTVRVGIGLLLGVGW